MALANRRKTENKRSEVSPAQKIINSLARVVCVCLTTKCRRPKGSQQVDYSKIEVL